MERSLSRALNPEVLSCAITLVFRGNSTISIRGVLEGAFEQMLPAEFGFFLFGMAIFLILLGLWAWNEASEAEDEGEPVELHSLGRPRRDFQELYRYLIDDFVIQYCRKLNRKDFTVKSENFSTKRKGKREYLNDSQTRDFVKALSHYFESKVRIPRVRMGDQQEIETLINEEALLFVMYVRDKRGHGFLE